MQQSGQVTVVKALTPLTPSCCQICAGLQLSYLHRKVVV